ncbi:MAG TPA: PPOX class F420-dependent oxidoreductase [Pseudomonadales bacterium]
MTDEKSAAELARLASAPYVSLETFRRSGVGVATPVWCAAEGGAVYVFSAGEAGKVKRLRNGDRARLAACDVRGRLLGAWHDARAVLVDDPAEIERALAALRRKYGWQMGLADLGAKLTGRFARRAYIRVELTGS